MQFLCLHGAIANVDNFSIQLDPLEKELSTDKAASFYYINGPCKINPPQGFEDYFGIGPHYRWFDDHGVAKHGMLHRVRQLPSGDNPEDIIRGLLENGSKTDVIDFAGSGSWKNHTEVLNYLYETLEAHPQIQGVIGYSEGSSLAGSLILDELKRYEQEGRPRRIKCAIFLTGWPPISPDETALLCDESSLVIDVPTLHVIGANDPYKYGGLALYNVCDENTAKLFDTGKGHTIPRAGPVIQELGDAVREMIGIAPIHGNE